MKFNIVLGGTALFSFIGVLSLKIIYIFQTVVVNEGSTHSHPPLLYQLHQIYVGFGFVILFITIINLIKLWELWKSTKHTIVSHMKKEVE